MAVIPKTTWHLELAHRLRGSLPRGLFQRRMDKEAAGDRQVPMPLREISVTNSKAVL